MKRIFLFTFIIFINFIQAEGKNQLTTILPDSNVSNKFKFKFCGTLMQDHEFVNNKDVGFWGFVDVNSSLEKQVFSGFSFGIISSLRFFKYLALFADVSIIRARLLMGKAGGRFKGMAVWDADPNHASSISPVLENDVYYVSKATMGRLGVKFIYYSANGKTEPYVAFAVGLVPYEIAFSNRNGTVAYSDIISETVLAKAIIVGTDFNIFSNNQKITTIGIFLDYGGVVTDAGTVMNNWIWEAWKYHAQFPIVPSFRFGLSLEF